MMHFCHVYSYNVTVSELAHISRKHLNLRLSLNLLCWSKRYVIDKRLPHVGGNVQSVGAVRQESFKASKKVKHSETICLVCFELLAGRETNKNTHYYICYRALFMRGGWLLMCNQTVFVCVSKSNERYWRGAQVHPLLWNNICRPANTKFIRHDWKKKKKQYNLIKKQKVRAVMLPNRDIPKCCNSFKRHMRV